jgi:hypothetical protein
MSETEPKCDAKIHREKWLKRLRMDLEKTEGLMPKAFWETGGETPKWVQNVERELCLPLFLAAKLRDPNFVITPKRMGAMIGHTCEKAVCLLEGFNDFPEEPAEIEPQTLTNEEKKQAEEIAEAVVKFAKAVDDWYQSMRRLAKLALCSCVDQTYEDMRDFLLGYADGFSRKPKKLKVGDFGSTASEIYLLMVSCWQLIEQMESVREFHEWLILHLGACKVRDQKRIEKICTRMGLHFRKPGRPKKK